MNCDMLTLSPTLWMSKCRNSIDWYAPYAFGNTMETIDQGSEATLDGVKNLKDVRGIRHVDFNLSGGGKILRTFTDVGHDLESKELNRKEIC